MVMTGMMKGVAGMVAPPLRSGSLRSPSLRFGATSPQHHSAVGRLQCKTAAYSDYTH